MSKLFTIGYATKRQEEFLTLLEAKHINCLVDVRTMPYSKQFPLYNRETLETELNSHNISYLFFGNEFGARRVEDEAYTKEIVFDGEELEYVDFDKVQRLSIFEKGSLRIINGIKRGYNICFMCSEKYPYDCHRAIMVSDWFYKNGYNVQHIVNENNSIWHNEFLQLPVLLEYFQKCKNIYRKKFEHSYDLFGNQKGSAEFFAYWDNFFSEYNYEKIIHLLNIKIGYKKGETNNE